MIYTCKYINIIRINLNFVALNLDNIVMSQLHRINSNSLQYLVESESDRNVIG